MSNKALVCSPFILKKQQLLPGRRMEKKNWNREEIRRVFRISHSLRVKVSDILKTVELLLHSQKKERTRTTCLCLLSCCKSPQNKHPLPSRDATVTMSCYVDDSWILPHVTGLTFSAATSRAHGSRNWRRTDAPLVT